jgi:tyrosine-protein kinase Etk/Wzc
LLNDDPFTKAVKDLSKGLMLKSYEDTYVFEIKYSDEDPQTAADVADTVARLFIRFMEDMRSSEGKDAANHLNSELEHSRQRLEEVRESLRKYKEAHGVFLYQPEYDEKLRVISDLTVELAKLDASYANESLSAGTIDANTYAKKRARLLKILNDNQADLASLPTIERELQLRQTDVDVANTTYGTVAKELKDAEIKADAMPEARLISPAFVPRLPSRPRRDIFLGVSLLTGLLVGVALAFFLEYINRTARGINDIEDFVGLKVIGTIPLAPRTDLRQA